jgi:CheY-like chemotaxis protein
MANILIVEPEAVLLRLIATSLQGEGHSTVTTSDSAEALAKLQDGANFDLVIADLDLKPFSGIKLARMIAMKSIRVRIVFMCDDRALAQALSSTLGTQFLIEKPFTPEDLLRQVKRVLAGRKAAGFGG